MGCPFLNCKEEFRNSATCCAIQVGLAACQIGKLLGLHVIGTAGSEGGMQLVKEVGRADHVFNHNDPNFFDLFTVSIPSFQFVLVSSKDVLFSLIFPRFLRFFTVEEMLTRKGGS